MASRILFAVLALVLVSSVNADDARERRVKVALALAEKAAPTAAPAPRQAAKCYTEGYRTATNDQMPLVVFVGCAWQPVEGAVVARADSLGDVTGPAVVIGYPVGGKLFIESTILGAPDALRVAASVKAAMKKIEVPGAKDMPAPKPLKWDI